MKVLTEQAELAFGEALRLFRAEGTAPTASP